MILRLHEILGSVSFGTPSDTFETNLQELGEALGFYSQRPEREVGKGPDNLWRIKKRSYWILSCKNETHPGQEYISKADVGQILSDIAWFNLNCDGESRPIFIHPGSKLDQSAAIDCPVWVIGENNLNKFKSNILNFFNEFQNVPRDRLTQVIITETLKNHHLDVDDLLKNYATRVQT